jgi:RNA polymerase sigma factor (TIGR02999 family)
MRAGGVVGSLNLLSLRRTERRSALASITELAAASDRGDGAAAEALFAALYEELHRLAEHHLARGGGHLTLGTTTLLHEAYLKLAEREGARFPDRNRFLAYASKALRGLVIDYARARRAKKRGGEFQITPLGDLDPAEAPPADTRLEQLADAIEALSSVDPALAQLVDLHVFAGFTLAEVASATGMSLRTTERQWQKARMLLQRLASGADLDDSA